MSASYCGPPSRNQKYEEVLQVFSNTMQKKESCALFLTINDSRKFKGKPQVFLQSEIGEVILFSEGTSIED